MFIMYWIPRLCRASRLLGCVGVVNLNSWGDRNDAQWFRVHLPALGNGPGRVELSLPAPRGDGLCLQLQEEPLPPDLDWRDGLRWLAPAFRAELQLEAGAPRPESLGESVRAHTALHSHLLKVADWRVIGVRDQHPQAVPEPPVPVGDRPLPHPPQPHRKLVDAHAPLEVLLLRKAGEDDDDLPAAHLRRRDGLRLTLRAPRGDGLCLQLQEGPLPPDLDWRDGLRWLARAFRAELQLEGVAPRPESLGESVQAHAAFRCPLLGDVPEIIGSRLHRRARLPQLHRLGWLEQCNHAHRVHWCAQLHVCHRSD
eukprot:gene12881-biopygen10794